MMVGSYLEALFYFLGKYNLINSCKLVLAFGWITGGLGGLKTVKASSAFRSKMRRILGLPPISRQTTRVNLAE